MDARVTCQAEFLQKIPLVKDLARLFLLCYGVCRANFHVSGPGFLTPVRSET